MNLVIDASVSLKWFFADRHNESGIERALAILDALDAGRVQIIQPPHFLAEIAAVLIREKGPAAAADLEDLQALDWQVLETAELYLEAMRLSDALDHHLFDTLYHAVALCSQETMLVTADRRYFRKASGLTCICLLEHLELAGLDS